MKKIIVSYILLVLIGCSKSEDNPDYHYTEIKFGTGIDSAISTRSPIESENGLVSQEIQGIQVIRDDTPTPFIYGVIPGIATATIKTETQNNKNLMQLNPVQYFNVDHSDAYFMAYHPAGTVESGKVNYTINGKQDIITSNQEKAIFGLKETINFQFIHQLTRVRLQIRAENDKEAAAFGYLTKSSINVPTKLELSINGTDFKLDKSSVVKSDLSFLTDNNPLKLKGGTQFIGELMIYPEQFNEITLGFTNKPEEVFTLNWNSVTNLLTAGTTNTITIDLKAFEIKFNVTVNGWSEGNNGGEEISIGGHK